MVRIQWCFSDYFGSEICGLSSAIFANMNMLPINLAHMNCVVKDVRYFLPLRNLISFYRNTKSLCSLILSLLIANNQGNINFSFRLHGLKFIVYTRFTLHCADYSPLLSTDPALMYM